MMGEREKAEGETAEKEGDTEEAEEAEGPCASPTPPNKRYASIHDSRSTACKNATCMCVCVRGVGVWKGVGGCARASSRMCVCMYVCTYVRMYACMHVCMNVCMHVCM